MAKKENLPLDIQLESNPDGSISYNSEVVAIIAGIAASEIEGIADSIPSGGWNENPKKARAITRGIKVELGTEEVSVDINLSMEYGTPIQKAAFDVQNNVKKSIETMTGLHVIKVDVHVLAVSFDKEMEGNKKLAEKTVPKISTSNSEK